MNHNFAASWLPWVALVGGAVVLAARYRRAPRAVGFALPVVVLTALVWINVPLVYQTWWRPPPWLQVAFQRAAILSVVFAPAMAVAAMLGRRPGGRDAD